MIFNSLKKQKLFTNSRLLSATASALLLSVSISAAPLQQKKPPVKSTKKTVALVSKVSSISENDKIVHLLNRLGYGPRPGDVEKVKAMGLKSYIEQQLMPDRIDDSTVDKKLAAFTELQMSPEQLATAYSEFTQGARKAQALNKANKKQQSKTDPTMAANGVTQTAPPGDAPTVEKKAPQMDAATRQQLQSQIQLLRISGRAAGQTPQQIRQSIASLRQATLNPGQYMPEMRQTRLAVAKASVPIARIHEEFMAAKVLRAVESEKQLQEVLVDFWGNHFNIDIRKPPCGVLKILDDRDTIRPHVYGKFRDLLGASAKSPAMMVYLDNYQSTSDTIQTPPARAKGANARKKAMLLGQATPITPSVPATPKKKRPTGLNENYAREIMELHTLGVDGGYSQQDVKEVARCMTGWSIGALNAKRPGAAGRYAPAGQFQFYPARHDNGEKTVLGHVIPAGGGQSDGEKVLDILASHPSTMRHISYQLCRRFVADEPPTTLIDKCVSTWQRTDGDLREIVRTIVTSPEFYSPAALNSKIKSPFEYAVSSVRALGGTYNTSVAVPDQPRPREAAYLIKPPKGGGFLDMNTTSLVGQVGTMGQPLFQFQAPTGYPEDSRKWVSSGALISRLNYSLALTDGKLSDVQLQNTPALSGGATDTNQMIDRLAAQILHGAVTPSTRATLLKQVSADTGSGASSALTPAKIAALLLGSPEFQRH